MTPPGESAGALKRDLGVGGATLMGLGSILGTGVFVSLAVAAGIAGPAVILATALAALVATCNALSSAQLAAAHPVSGGTYEYGYRYLSPALGFSAGWMFLCAKTASAATAALGFSGYALNMLGAQGQALLVGVAVGGVLVLTLIAAGGVRNTSRFNLVVVGITLAALLAFVVAVLPAAWRNAPQHLTPFFQHHPETGTGPLANVLQATALMFVAYTGYGRIATLGEEVRDPARTIPRAIVLTLIVSALLYIAVAVSSLGAAGVNVLEEAVDGTAAPLETVAREFGLPGLHWLVALGAVTAMLGVLINLLLGLSRILLAMGRRGDAPAITARLSRKHHTPAVAVSVVGLAIAAMALIGDIKLTWSFSAFTVLVYYAITNLAALRLPPEDRRYPRAWAWGGLVSCLFLAFWVETRIWLAGLALLGAGLLWHTAARRWHGESGAQS